MYMKCLLPLPLFINISNTLPATHKTSKYKVVKQLLHAKHIFKDSRLGFYNRQIPPGCHDIHVFVNIV